MLTKIEIEYLIEIIENEISSYIDSGYSKNDEYVLILNNILLKFRNNLKFY